MDIRQAEIATLQPIGRLRVVEAEHVRKGSFRLWTWTTGMPLQRWKRLVWAALTGQD